MYSNKFDIVHQPEAGDVIVCKSKIKDRAFLVTKKFDRNNYSSRCYKIYDCLENKLIIGQLRFAGKKEDRLFLHINEMFQFPVKEILKATKEND